LNVEILRDSVYIILELDKSLKPYICSRFVRSRDPGHLSLFLPAHFQVETKLLSFDLIYLYLFCAFPNAVALWGLHDTINMLSFTENTSYVHT